MEKNIETNFKLDLFKGMILPRR